MVLASTATDGSDPLIRLDHGSDRLSTVKHGARLASNRLAIRVFSKWSVKESSDTSRMSLQLPIVGIIIIIMVCPLDLLGSRALCRVSFGGALYCSTLSSGMTLT